MSDLNLDSTDFDRLIEENVARAGEPAVQPDPLASAWATESLADAYQYNEPIAWLIEGLVPIPSLSIFYGMPGGYKSLILGDLATCVATGRPWLEAMPDEGVKPGKTFLTHQSRVVWIDLDNGRRRTRERMAALGRGHDCPADTPLEYVSMPMPWLDASDPTMTVNFATWIERRGYRLVVIDNLELITGSIEENSGAMATVMGRLRWISEKCNCAVVIVHHQRKNNGGEKGTRKGEALRGHRSIEAAIDLALMVERAGQATEVAVIPTKVRDFGDFGIFGAQFAFEHYGPNDRRMKWAKFYSKLVETSDEVLNAAIRGEIKAVVRAAKKTVNQKELVEAVRDSMAAKPGGKAPAFNKVRGLLKHMVEHGHLFEVGESANKKAYRLP